MFYDHTKIFVRAGDGGNGSRHFRREKFAPLEVQMGVMEVGGVVYTWKLQLI